MTGSVIFNSDADKTETYFNTDPDRKLCEKNKAKERQCSHRTKRGDNGIVTGENRGYAQIQKISSFWLRLVWAGESR